VETALDVEWAHAMAPGAQIILVEANSQTLADLMAGVTTAASQPGVSVVSISWGYAEGLGVLAADESAYDSAFTTPGVTFVASTGDYGSAAPVYPAFSPNVLAVGGTSLTLNGDNTYNSETGWGYTSSSLGAFIGSGGGISQYETEPAYQGGVQSTGYRTTPDVSFVADPATGAWVADQYNLDPSNPWEVVGGTSLSAPCWAGLIALVNQGRVAAGQPTLNSTSPTQTQQALYSLSQTDYNGISSGSNGYSALAGYNLVTGLGTPIANLLVSDLIASNFPISGQVAPISAAGLVNSGGSAGNAGSVGQVMNVFMARTMAGGHQGRTLAEPVAFPEPIGEHDVPAAAPLGVPNIDLVPATGVAHQVGRSLPVPLPGFIPTYEIAAGTAWGTPQRGSKAASFGTRIFQSSPAGESTLEARSAHPQLLEQPAPELLDRWFGNEWDAPAAWDGPTCALPPAVEWLAAEQAESNRPIRDGLVLTRALAVERFEAKGSTSEEPWQEAADTPAAVEDLVVALLGVTGLTLARDAQSSRRRRFQRGKGS
jgi:hypothetical protein